MIQANISMMAKANISMITKNISMMTQAISPLWLISVVDPNTLNLDPDPGFWPNLDPDPGNS